MRAGIVVYIVHLLSTYCVLGPVWSLGIQWRIKTNSSAPGAHGLERETGTKGDKHMIM